MKQRMIRGLLSLSVVGLVLTGCGITPAKEQGNSSAATTAPTAAAKGEPTQLVIST